MIDDLVTSSDEVKVELVSSGYLLRDWTEYTINADYETPTAGWNMHVPEAHLPAQAIAGLSTGAEVRMISGGEVIGRGYIDASAVNPQRGTGRVFEITGRDILSPAVDAHISPKFRLKIGMTLYDTLVQLFDPFGLKVIADDAALGILLGGTVSGVRKIRDGNEFVADPEKGAKDGRPPSPFYKTGKKGYLSLSSPRMADDKLGLVRYKEVPKYREENYEVTYVAGGRHKKIGKTKKAKIGSDVKPNPDEGVFAYANRIAEKFGLMLHLSPYLMDDCVLATAPNFDQPSVGAIFRFNEDDPRSMHNTILAGRPALSILNQPSFIYAEGYGGGKEFNKSKIKSFIRNPFVVSPGIDDEIATLKREFEGVREVPTDYYDVGQPNFAARCRGIYKHHDDARTQEELDQYLRTELAKHAKSSLAVKYTVKGHTAPNGTPWNIDTIVDVYDYAGGVVERLWIKGRTFKRSRATGTTTELDVIRRYTLEI